MTFPAPLRMQCPGSVPMHQQHQQQLMLQQPDLTFQQPALSYQQASYQQANFQQAAQI